MRDINTLYVCMYVCMSDFKAKMHQIRFRLGLRSRSRCRSLQRSPDALAGFKGATLRQAGRRGRDVERGIERDGREGKGRG